MTSLCDCETPMESLPIDDSTYVRRIGFQHVALQALENDKAAILLPLYLPVALKQVQIYLPPISLIFAVGRHPVTAD
ncbi:hypothetical protein SCP_0110400 [Sparassis crispa]|uniref:Uncharacterized protein n=1 Tax=Sparassis crispa TaxID=139825 RepID=A0A401G7M3_9APHY|nr:hypothetical protein SCP_0110400 [Sparassis crispa]GBE78157.1 hypothetical protein SCP_0110400 [Sparassis crispa]